jgi:cytochrome c biogenesis factor
MTVTRGSEYVGMVEPSFNFFGDGQGGVGTPDVLHRPGGDLYFTLRELPDPDAGGSVTLTIDTSPMIWILWLGGLVTVIGGFLAMRARRRERQMVDDRQPIHV